MDIITIGDSTVDVYLQIDEAIILGEQSDNCQICFKYGSKIPVQKIFTFYGAGNAMNCAIGLKKLGLKTAICTNLGSDDKGKIIKNKIAKEGILDKYVRFEKNKDTNYSTIIEYKNDRTIFGFHEERKYKMPDVSKDTWIYYSSISGNHEEFNKNLVKFIKKNKNKLLFNPGTVQMRLGIEKLKHVLEVTSVLFVNKEEAEILTGEISVGKMLETLRSFGPEIVVITDGQNGSYSLSGSNAWFFPIYESKVVQRTGCGDAYASGFTAALFNGQAISEAMRWGSANAAGVVQKTGPQAGLMKKSDLKKFLARAKKNYPQKINLETI